jgi:hypothetical protein
MGRKGGLSDRKQECQDLIAFYFKKVVHMKIF